LAVRAGDPRAADELLDAARRRLEQLAQNPPRSRPAIEGLFAAKTHLPAPGHYGATLAELDRLTWLMSRNDTLTDPPAAAALGDMLQLNPYQRGYQQRLARLVEKHAETPLAGNIRLAVAQGTADIYTRAERLLNVTDQWREDPDAAIEASYELGRLILREPVLQLNPRVQSPAHYFTLVAQQAPPNPWQRLARDRLQQLDQHPAGQP
jgi:hypothetical protein